MESQLTAVQRLAKQFENLAAAQTQNEIKPMKCNWWLETGKETPEKTEDNVYTNERDAANLETEIDCANGGVDAEHRYGADEETEDYFDDESDFFTDEEDIPDIDHNIVALRNPINPTRQSIGSISTSSTIANRLDNIIQELYETEQSYVNTLAKGIEGYLTVFNDRNLPNTLRGQRNKIFGTIERIRDLHQSKFYPNLLECNGDLEKICQTFCKFIQQDYFYVYVQYAINKQTSDRICELNGDYFKQHQTKIEDKLGILSILVQPIQRLPRYKLLLISIFNELVKQMESDNVKEQIGWCCKAEKHMDRLLEIFNESMSINDILECNEINILHQGKFYKVNDFDITDNTIARPSRRFNGRVFLFEKCLVYTETLDKSKLQFRGHFPHGNAYFEYKEGKSKFKLRASQRIDQQIVFMASFNVIQEWVKLIRHLQMQTLELEKRKSDEKYKRRSEFIRPSSETNIRRKAENSGSGSSWQSSNRTSSGSAGSDTSGYNSESRTTWYSKLEYLNIY